MSPKDYAFGLSRFNLALRYSFKNCVEIINHVFTTLGLRSCDEICLFGFSTSSSAARIYRGRIPRLTSDNFTCCLTEAEQGDI